MRTLTLGVLIVTTGTLAALPFRNRPLSGPDEQPTRTPVSGPSTDLVAENWPDRRSERLLEPAPLRPSPESLRETPTSARTFGRVSSSWNGATAEHDGGRDRGLNRLSEISQGSDAISDSDPSDQTIKPESSYEDWMIPVDDSQLIRERFSATVSGLAPDDSEPHDSEPDGSEPDGSEPVRERQAGNAPPHLTDAVPASLRSGSPDPPNAERHWIRQPR